MANMVKIIARPWEENGAPLTVGFAKNKRYAASITAFAGKKGGVFTEPQVELAGRKRRAEVKANA